MSAIPEHLKYNPHTIAGVFAPPTRPQSVQDALPINSVRHKGKTVWISQSLLKDFEKMENGLLCPKQFYYKYVMHQNVENRSSGAMEAGKRFEYLLTGQRDKYNQPTFAIKTGKGAVSADETRAKTNAEFAYETLKKHGFEFKRLVSVGETVDVVKAKTGVTLHTNGMSGTLDLLCKKNGQTCIVDLKYSGLLGDKWNEMGWYWEDETHPNYIGNNLYQRTQATHYTLLYLLRFGKKLPFYYAVFDSRAGREGNYQIFEMNISDAALILHLRRVDQAAIKLRAMLKTAKYEDCGKNAFCPVGSFGRCQLCLLASTCTKRVDRQEEVIVTI